MDLVCAGGGRPQDRAILEVLVKAVVPSDQLGSGRLSQKSGRSSQSRVFVANRRQHETPFENFQFKAANSGSISRTVTASSRAVFDQSSTAKESAEDRTHENLL